MWIILLLGFGWGMIYFWIMEDQLKEDWKNDWDED